MNLDPTDPKTWLELEFNQRRARNSNYSLRTLAQKLEIPSGRLSELISGKRRITARLGRKIAARLAFSPEKMDRFLTAIEHQYKSDLVDHDRSESDQVEFHPLTIDSFYSISDWYHFAILSLMNTDDFESDPKWIARRLGIPVLQARSAVDRLQRLGLLIEQEERYLRGTGQITTTHDLESVALKNSHRQSLEQAIDALESIPVELRDITSMTMAIDMSRLPKAKEMIKKFRRQLCRFLESGDQKQEVYNINIQLVPVTKVRKEDKQK